MAVTNLEAPAGADVFSSHIVRTVNAGFVSLVISIGHRTGLFEVLASLPPSTSGEIASTAGLAERYVREWLAAMTMARIIQYDVRTGTYALPVEYAAVLSSGAGAGNLAPVAELLSMLAGVEDQVVAVFHSGGGVEPEAYERILECAGAQKRHLAEEESLLAILELMPAIHARLAAGGCVLDVGCGDGAVLLQLARMFPRAAFRGYDLSRATVERANARAVSSGLQNVEFAVGDVASLDDARCYDLVLALESIHEQAFPRLVLRNVANALKRDGVFLMQEVAASSHLARNAEHPFAPMLYALSLLHAIPVANAPDGEALGKMWGKERARQMLGEAGFDRLRFVRIPSDPLRYYCVAQK